MRATIFNFIHQIIYMLTTYNTKAPKKATNLSVNQDLLKRARALKLNLSQVLEDRLIELLREQERQVWLTENKDAIQDYNDRVEKHGVFSDGKRRF